MAIHPAPTCCTTLKAREKKLWNFRNKGCKVSGPLRAKDKPMGLNKLTDLDKMRTEVTNMVYSVTATIMKFCNINNIWCTLENPENFFVLEILQDHVGFSVYFHHCMHGDTWNKQQDGGTLKMSFFHFCVWCWQPQTCHMESNSSRETIEFPHSRRSRIPHHILP